MNFNSKKIISLLIVLELITLFLAYKSYLNKEIEEIKETSNTTMIAMYIQDEETGEYYETKKLDKFPENKRINIDKSYCKDSNNEIIKDILTTDYKNVYVRSKKTVFCTLYFDNVKKLYDVIKNDYSNLSGSSRLASEYLGNYNKSEHEKIYYYTSNTSTSGNNLAATIREKWNVVFGGLCWQMFRTTENGGVKMIYNGEPILGTDANGVITYDCSDGRPDHTGYYSDWITDLSLTEEVWYGTSYEYDGEKYIVSGDTKKSVWGIEQSDSLVGLYTCNKSSIDDTCEKIYLVTNYATDHGTYADAIIGATLNTTTKYNLIANSITWNNSLTEEYSVGYMKKNVDSYFNDGYIMCDGVIYPPGISHPDCNSSSSLYAYSNSCQSYMGVGIDRIVLSSIISSSYKFSDEYNFDSVWSNYYNGWMDSYTLVSPQTASELIGSNNNYENLVGKYALVPATSPKLNNDIDYVIGYTDSNLYMIRLRKDHNVDYYKKTLKLSSTADKNQDGTYTLTGDIKTVDNIYWWNLSSSESLYNYICENGETTCDAKYIVYKEPYMYYCEDPKYDFMYGYDYVERSSQEQLDGLGKYKLVGKYNSNNELIEGTLFSTFKVRQPDGANSTIFDQAHYTCFNSSGICDNIRFIYNYSWDGVGKLSRLSNVLIRNGNKVNSETSNTNNYFYNLLTSNDINQKNSVVKSIIDGWYAKYLIDYDEFIDDEEAYCNDRQVDDFGPWSPDGTLKNSTFSFVKTINDYTCNRKLDSFTSTETSYGNGALKYPIGLMSYAEAVYMKNNNLLKTGTAYQLMSPKNSSVMHFISASGSYSNSGSGYGVRPVIALKERLDPEEGETEGRIIEYIRGDGSTTNPYVVETDFE